LPGSGACRGQGDAAPDAPVDGDAAAEDDAGGEPAEVADPDGDGDVT
jgi:hypothetical protein